MVLTPTHLLFLGFVSKTSCDFILIQEPKIWTEAQSFCRQHHQDLATVQSDQDRSKIQEITRSVSFDRGWMGLYDGLCNWRWSFQNQELVYKNWGPLEDTTTRTQRKCGVIRSTGTWHTASCDELKPFICFNGGSQFSLITMKRTWRDAQSYCRMNYIDLAIIISLSDNTKIVNLLDAYHEYEGWIGLSKNLWLWSDQSSVDWLSLQWVSGEPDNGIGNERCGFIFGTGLFGDDICSHRLPFICTKAKRSQKQLVRVAVRSAGPLDESAVMAAVKEKISQMLSQQAMAAGSSVTWRVQADGKIFQLQEKSTPNKKTRCEERSTAVRLPRDHRQP